MEQVNIETVNKNVMELMKIVQEMKEDLEDRFLTPEEEMLLEVSREEFKKGNCISLEDLKKELNV
jgi:hypothetical protein